MIPCRGGLPHNRTMDKPLVIRGWPKGVNTVLPDESLPDDVLRAGINIDVLDSGKIRRRKGWTEIIGASDVRSGTSFEGSVYFVQGGSFKRLEADGTATTLATGLADRYASFCKVNDELYLSTGVAFRVLRDGVVNDLGAPACQLPPGLVRTAGALPAGTYQALATFVKPDGEEGGCAAASSITVVEGSSITVTAPAGDYAVRLYLTPANGEVFYQVADMEAGESIVFTTMIPQGPECQTQFCVPMPPGDIIEIFKGHLYSASGNILWHSEPFRYGLCRPSKNFFIFPAPITLLKASTDGIYVGSDQIYFLAGTGPSDFRQDLGFLCTAAAHSVSDLPNSDNFLFFGSRGVALAMPSGQIELLHDAVAPPGVFDEGATVFREQDGLAQWVGVGRVPQYASGLVAMDYMEAEIVRARS